MKHMGSSGRFRMASAVSHSMSDLKFVRARNVDASSGSELPMVVRAKVAGGWWLWAASDGAAAMHYHAALLDARPGAALT